MQIIHGLSRLSAEHRPSVVSIGSYDGVHLGHQQLIRTLLEKSAEYAAAPTIITFDPLAKEFFSPGKAVRINSLEQRCEQLSALGVERLVCIDFNEEFAACSPKDFVQQVLVDGLATKYLCVGDDFRFGKDRKGDFEFLKTAGQVHGFSLMAHETFTMGGERVSSGRVRDALQSDNFTLAAELLGRPYTINGIVSRGQKIGRTIDFPTANIVLKQSRYAVHGVYVVQVTLENCETQYGIANIGLRPTVDGAEHRLEVHLFNFNAYLYDQKISVQFLRKIRTEKKFESLDDLKQQIAADAISAKTFIKGIR